MDRDVNSRPEPMPEDWANLLSLAWSARPAAFEAQARARLLQEAYERFQALATITGQIIWTARPDGMVEDSPFWRAYTGQTSDELRGLGWMDAIHPEDREHVRECWAQALASRRFFELEYRIRRADGVYRPFLVRGVPVLDAEGNIREWAGICTDISEHKRIEEERARALAREQQARAEAAARASQLQTTIEAMPDGIGIYTPQGNTLYMNRSGQRILGIDDPERFRLFTSRSHPERLALLQCRDKEGHPYSPARSPLTRALQGEIVTDAESEDVVITALDGRERYLSATAAPIRDAEGQLTGAVFVYRDVTERHYLERRTSEALDALLEMAEALVGSEAAEERLLEGGGRVEVSLIAQRLAALTARVLGYERVGIAAVDPETTQLLPLAVVTPSAEEEQRWWASRPHAPRLSESTDPTLLERLSTGAVMVVDMSREPLHAPHPFHLPTLLVAPMCIGKHLIGILTIGHDRPQQVYTPQDIALAGAVAKLTALVIERDHLLHQREEARANELAIREANRQLEAFLGMATHELKTPLTSILMGQEMLQRRVQRLQQALAGATGDIVRQVEAVQALADTTFQQARRLNRLVNDLLDVSRIQAGRLALHIEPVDLAEVIRSAVEEQRQAASEREIILHLPSRTVPVRADADRIRQVVMNYLTNALKYSPEDCPVTVGLGVEEQHARVWVRDEGPGISPGAQERLWERFHRVPGIEIRSGSGIGLGIGLHISKTIIDQHGGQVGVESAPGQGSTFWFTLPLEPPDQDQRLRGG